ncbi:hypothetical protein GCM10011514_40030 [Emticicia aquatilis]|uniref:Uncharacterized protein n=1 Tax=Emticicia aquatilis TaxID=1537369 RepID=A0A916Z1R3_9BACT|nr:hypothetical protein [Emticicia aquatilis]GGD71899.1 hypothetical protein GCM10011514_40030 [Emticicia aquatilis]
MIEPNASNFGINLSIFKAFDIKDDDSKRFLGAYLKNYFLFKDLPNQKTIQTKSKEGSKVINTAFIQINGGIEFAPVPKIRDVFTVYSGGNLIWNLNQYDNFKSYFQNNTKKVQYYFNTGFRFSIPLAVDAGKISNSLLVVDINCLFVNQSLRQLHNISDSVIPVMSLGIKKSIAKL